MLDIQTPHPSSASQGLGTFSHREKESPQQSFGSIYEWLEYGQFYETGPATGCQSRRTR